MKTLLALLAFLPMMQAHASLSTLSLPDGGYEVVSWNTWKAQSFSIGASGVASLVTDVSLKLENVVANTHFQLFIAASAANTNVPDLSAVMAELRPAPGQTTVGGALTSMAFSVDQTKPLLALQPETTYWLIAGSTAADDDSALPAGLVRWHFSSTNGQDPGGTDGWSVGGRVAYSDTEGKNWVSSPETPYSFGITAVPIPEPSGAMALTFAGVMFLNRRRRPKARTASQALLLSCGLAVCSCHRPSPASPTPPPTAEALATVGHGIISAEDLQAAGLERNALFTPETGAVLQANPQENFRPTAAQYSDDTDTRYQGGDLGWKALACGP